MKNALVAAVVAAVVAAASGTAATMIVTSKNIKNGTIQTVDISAAATRALKGNRGPRGFQGASGVQGQPEHLDLQDRPGSIADESRGLDSSAAWRGLAAHGSLPRRSDSRIGRRGVSRRDLGKPTEAHRRGWLDRHRSQQHDRRDFHALCDRPLLGERSPYRHRADRVKRIAKGSVSRHVHRLEALVTDGRAGQAPRARHRLTS
jgi:hypothetical protein